MSMRGTFVLLAILRAALIGAATLAGSIVSPYVAAAAAVAAHEIGSALSVLYIRALNASAPARSPESASTFAPVRSYIDGERGAHLLAAECPPTTAMHPSLDPAVLKLYSVELEGVAYVYRCRDCGATFRLTHTASRSGTSMLLLSHRLEACTGRDA